MSNKTREEIIKESLERMEAAANRAMDFADTLDDKFIKTCIYSGVEENVEFTVLVFEIEESEVVMRVLSRSNKYFKSLMNE